MGEGSGMGRGLSSHISPLSTGPLVNSLRFVSYHLCQVVVCAGHFLTPLEKLTID